MQPDDAQQPRPRERASHLGPPSEDKLVIEAPEDFFAAAVKSARQRLGMTQKDLSAALAERGVRLDATAITRIERGATGRKRSIRLGEALILASVLGLDMTEVMTQTAEPPEQILATRRTRANKTINHARSVLSQLVADLWGVQDVLGRFPELLPTLVDDDTEVAPTAASDYIAWVSKRIEATAKDDPHWFVLHVQPEKATKYQQVLDAIQTSLITEDDPPSDPPKADRSDKLNLS